MRVTTHQQMFRRGLKAKLLNVDIRKKPQPEIAFNMVNSRQRKRRIRMNEYGEGTKMFEGEIKSCIRRGTCK